MVMASTEDGRKRAFEEITRGRARENDSARQRSPLRLHAQIRSGIRLGVLETKDRLDEDQLIKTYSTSRNSVRTALALLAEEGVVSRGPRHGTVVARKIEDIRVDNGIAWSPEENSRHVLTPIGSTLIPTTPLIRRLLQTQSSTVQVNQWVDCRDGEPFLIYIKYVVGDGAARPLSVMPPYQSFESLFEQAHGAPLARIDTSIQSVSSDERTARLLNVTPGSSLLLKERLLWDATGTPREFSHTYYIASRAAMTSTAWAPGYAPSPSGQG